VERKRKSNRKKKNKIIMKGEGEVDDIEKRK
jgi:hypothetical protein